MLGEARSKFATIASPQGGTQLNGDTLKQDAMASKEKLEQELTLYVEGSAAYGFVIGNGCYSVNIVNCYAQDLRHFVSIGDNEGINLKLCSRILPVLENLLAEHCKYDAEHKDVILGSVNILFQGFSGLIKRNRHAASVHVGTLDINGEERNRRSELCYQSFCRILGKQVFD